MPELIHIDPEQLDYVWPKVEAAVLRAVATNKGEESVDQVKLKVRRGEYQLLVYAEDDVILTVVLAEFMNLPNVRLAHVAYAAESLTNDGVEAFKNWAKLHGASQIQAFCGEAQARLFKRHGFSHTYHVMRVTL